MRDILSLQPEEISDELILMGEKPFRGKQIFAALHGRRVASFDEMTDLSKALRGKLSENFTITRLTAEREQVSREDGTRKLLYRLPDGNLIESVYMVYHYGNTICVSTQVGCRMGCTFCASTVGGLVRNLTAGEILSQVYEMERITGTEINHVVLMGSGEPFDNYDEVVRFIRLITNKTGRNLSIRNITLSTSGLAEKIRAFSEEKLPVTLALSLHASNDETRRRLMPVARKYTLKEVLSACDYYFEKTGRRVSFEYAVVADVNDTKEAGEELGELLRGKNALVNLIPVNPVRENQYERPSRTKVLAFQKTLEKYGINATIRRELGRDIDGACGQLRCRAVNGQRKGEKSS